MCHIKDVAKIRMNGWKNSTEAQSTALLFYFNVYEISGNGIKLTTNSLLNYFLDLFH